MQANILKVQGGLLISQGFYGNSYASKCHGKCEYPSPRTLENMPKMPCGEKSIHFEVTEKRAKNTTGCFKNAKSPKCHDAKRPPHVNRIGYSTFVHAPTKCPFHVVRFHTPTEARHHRRRQNHLDVTSKALRQWSLWTWMNFITMRGMIFKHMSRKNLTNNNCVHSLFSWFSMLHAWASTRVKQGPAWWLWKKVDVCMTLLGKWGYTIPICNTTGTIGQDVMFHCPCLFRGGV